MAKTKAIVKKEKQKIVKGDNWRSQIHDQLADTFEEVIRKNKLVAGSENRGDRLSTGLLVMDLVLGGGIVAGGWYTNFGGEQSAKSTLAQQIMFSAVSQRVPFIHFWDYEGCTTADTNYMVCGKNVPFSDLLPAGFQIPKEKCFLPINVNIDSVGVENVAAVLYYGGIQPITKISTDSAELKGYRHPVMVLTEDERLAWKHIEEIKEGDVVVCQNN